MSYPNPNPSPNPNYPNPNPNPNPTNPILGHNFIAPDTISYQSQSL